ncbi:MAG: galactokinase family protein, partial [Candidatus Heimdallarchaeota archaeon]
MNKKSEFQYYSAPGRVCLYGEHQDYLKLKVVPAAINLRTVIGIKDNGLESIRINSHDLDSSDEFSLSKKMTLAKNEFDYLRAIVIALQKEGLANNLTGLDVTISSSVPIGSGLSSSAALLVAWTTALNDKFQLNLNKE